MKLKELFENNPISFAFEDNTYIGDQPLEKQQVSFDVAYSRPLGTYNGHEIWGSRYFGKDIDLYGILDEHRNVLAWCIFDTVKNPGSSTFLRAYVDKAHRGQSLTLMIINFLTEKTKEKIIIDKDEVTSDASRGMIKSWFNSNAKCRFKMKFFNNCKLMRKTDIDKILKAGVKNEISITMEAISDKVLPRYGSGERILMDWSW